MKDNGQAFIQMMNTENKKMQTSFDKRTEKMQTSFDTRIEKMLALFDTQIQDAKNVDEGMKTLAADMEVIHDITFWICFIAGSILLAKLAVSKSMQANVRLFYDKSRRKLIRGYVAVCSGDDEEENDETVHIFEETINTDHKGELQCS